MTSRSGALPVPDDLTSVGSRARILALSPTAERDELALLRAAVEGSLDAVVVVSSDATLLTYNARFQRIWPIPQEVVDSGSDDAALGSVLDKLVDPETFLHRVRELYDRASGVSRDELYLLDGRVLDRHGAALTDSDGSYVGWAWYFRDVTDERLAAGDAERMAALVEVAHALGDARSERDVLAVVNDLGAPVLQVAGVVLCLLEPDGQRVRTLATEFFDGVQQSLDELSTGSRLPLVQVAVTGQSRFFEDRESLLQEFPEIRKAYAGARTEAAAAVPLLAGGEPFGSLGVALETTNPWRPGDRTLLEALASLTAQALDRIRAQESERQATAQVRSMSETLQRSLLTAPPQSERLTIGVRYQPAAEQAQVGGDWYDAFSSSDGRMSLVVGDVAGHDRNAAAAMAQARNVLRGIGLALEASPSVVLSALDSALDRLHMASMATAVLCQTWACTDPGAEPGSFVLRWSNAGHPPPLLLHPDGTAELLERPPELLLGMDPAVVRQDHETVLAPGATLVLYTDGLVERRRHDLDEGLERLRSAAVDLAPLPPDDLCEALLLALASGSTDDVALLVMRVAD